MAAQTTNQQGIKYDRLKAMQHPLRAKCLRRLVESGPFSPAQLAREMGEDFQQVNYHMKRLELYGCAEIVTTRPVRGAIEHFYAATERHLLDMEEWARMVEEAPEVGEAIIDDIVQRVLDDYTSSRLAGVVGSDEYFHIARTPRQLDQRGLEEMLELAERVRGIGNEIEQRALKRANDSGCGLSAVSETHLIFKV